jgi:hypothetical protein
MILILKKVQDYFQVKPLIMKIISMNFTQKEIKMLYQKEWKKNINLR